MSYNPNSPQARKGAIGERIVKLFLEDWGADVKRPDNAPDDSPTLIDFHATPKPGEKFHERLVEVKVRTTMPYAFGQYPCYAFPVVQIEAYKNFAAERGLDCELWIVDPDKGELFHGSLTSDILDNIERKKFIDGREFPFDQMTKRGLMRFYHCKQFGEGGYDLNEIFPDGLAALRAIDAADDELERRCLEHFGKPFPETVREGFRELQRDFSDDDIFNAIVAFSKRDDDGAPILIEKLLGGSKVKVLADMFLNRVRDELSKPSPPVANSVESPSEVEESANVLLDRLANIVDLSADDIVEALLEMRQIRFEEQQARLKTQLLGGTKHERQRID